MQLRIFPAVALLTTAIGAMGADRAEAVVFDVSWTGNEATLEGRLTFDDSLLGTGIINETQIESLLFEVFSQNVLLGTAFLDSSAATFTLNFDTDAEQFVVSGFAGVQNWDVGGTVGFSSSLFFGLQGVSFFDIVFDSIPVADSTLVATRTTAVIPLPASALLLLTGLGALCLSRRRGG